MGLFDNIFNAKKTEEPTKKAKKIGKKVIAQQLYRFNKQIDTWKLGIDCFEDVYHSTTETIISVYNDVVIDAHLSAAIDTRICKTTSKDFKIVDEKGEELDETEVFNAQWFRDFMRFSLESKFYGYSLIQFGDRVGDGFKMIKLVPRQYVYPQKQSVRTTPQNTVDLIPFDKGQYKPWTIGVGRPEDIGLLMKACPPVIYKKTALGSWSEFTELFGAPFRAGKTNVLDDALRENMYDMLDNMGRNAFGVFHRDDELEYIKDNQTDAHHVFDELIERTNSEISKLILGSTMTMDDGSSRSQSEVHERTTGAIEKEDAIFMSEVVNKQLIPWLNTYHGFNITGKWVFDDTESIAKTEQFKMDIELVKNGFNVPKEYFTETYGTPIDEKEEIEEAPKGPGSKKELDADNSLKKKVFSLTAYENFIEGDSCEVCNTIDLSDTPEPEWSDVFINEIIAGVHSGLYTLTNLPESLYLETADRLVKSMLEGVAESKVIPTIADPDFVRALRNNAYIFSGAKTFQEVKTMSDFLLDENGEFRSFADFKKKAEVTFDQFNKNWLRTEMTQAHNTAEAASKWQQFEEEKDVFPYLRYDTAGDERVRASHKALDGVIKPVGDKFWDVHAVPNGWNCRCEILQESEAVATPDGDITLPDDIPESMQFNPGKQKVLFSPEHPYFVVDDQFSELRDNNFNLPDPPKFTPSKKALDELRELQRAAQASKTVNKDLLFTTLSPKLTNDMVDLLDAQDGASKIINDAKTSIGLRSTTNEVGKKGAEKWQTKTGANNRKTLDYMTAGHCQIENKYINVKIAKDENLNFESVKMDFTIDEVLKIDPTLKVKGNAIWKPKAGANYHTGFGKVLDNGKVKFYSVSEASSLFSKSVTPTFTHEVNHLIHNKFDPTSILGGRRKTSELAKKMGVSMRADSVTEYGTYNWSEFFAENMTVYIHANKYMKVNHRKTFNFMEALLDEFGVDKKTFKIAK